MKQNSRADVYVRLLALADELNAMAVAHATIEGRTALTAGAMFLRGLARAFFQAMS